MNETIAATFPCRRCGGERPLKYHRCFMNACVEYYCTGCGVYQAGFGPAGCFCDWGPGMVSGERGHRRKAEQPRRPAPWRAAYGRRHGRRVRRDPRIRLRQIAELEERMKALDAD